MDFIQNEIQKSWAPHQCTTPLQVEDSSQGSAELVDSKGENLHLIIPILLAVNTSVSLSFEYKFRLWRPCSVVFIKISHNFVIHGAAGSEDNAYRWPEIRFPGSPLQAHHVFVMSSSSKKSQMLDFARTTRKIQPSWYAVSSETTLDVYHLSVNADRLILAGHFPHKNGKILSSYQLPLKSDRLDYEGAPLVVNVCPACGKGIEYFRKTGTWNSLIEGVVYELILLANGTYNEQKLMTLARTGPNEKGEWDEWTQPLIDGTAAISTLQRYNTPGSRVVLYSRPAFYDYVCFITQKPKRIVKSQGLKLLSPLSPEVWLASCISVLMIFLFIEISVRAHRKMLKQWLVSRVYLLRFQGVNQDIAIPNFLPAHAPFSTLSAVLNPLLDQGGMDESLSKNIRNDAQSKVLLGLWLLLIIVLLGGYKSAMTSMLVMPAYTVPPSTFKELAYSNFKVFVVFWPNNLEVSFKSLNNVVGKRVVERAVVYKYYDKDVSRFYTAFHSFISLEVLYTVESFYYYCCSAT